MKVIIDGVFNHTGTAHPAFQDIRKNGEKSRFKNWYNITSWQPLDWEGWFGGKDLPVFKEDANGYVDPTLRAHIKAITARWMDPNGDGDPGDGIDGWRLDVANEVSSAWWREWRDYVKSINPQAIIMGEIWDPPAKYLQGDQFDCVMNYTFAKALTHFFADAAKPSELVNTLTEHLHNVPDQSNYVMMNLLDSHDTDRAVSMLFNPGRQYDQNNRLQDQKPGGYVYKADKPTTETYHKLKAEVAMQFGYVGGPMIYYGDEAGMWGADDPECRKPMIWPDLQPYEKSTFNYFMRPLHDYYQKCAAIRNSVSALQTGDFEVLICDDTNSILVIRRADLKQQVLIACNNGSVSHQIQIELGDKAPSSYVDLLNDPAVKLLPGKISSKAPTSISIGDGAKPLMARAGKLELSLAPQSTTVLLGQ
jgi:glycosidase